MSSERLHRVRGLIDAYEPLRDEAPIVADFLAMLDTPAPLDRTQFKPGHITASGFVLSPDLGSLLLIEHRRLARWLQPGGHVDSTDPGAEAAARREIGEETGAAELASLVTGLFGLNHHPIPPRPSSDEHRAEPAHRHFDLKFAYLAAGFEIAPSDEVSDVRWVKLDDVPDLGVDDETLHELAKLRSLI